MFLNRRFLVVGGGNLGIACAARLAASGHAVSLWTSNPSAWPRKVSVEDCDGRTYFGEWDDVSSEPNLASDVDLVFLCLPGNAMKAKLRELSAFINPNTPVAAVFGGDGFLFLSREILGIDHPIMAFQRVPFICRTKIPYRVGGITGYRKMLNLAHANVQDIESWRVLFEEAFATPTRLLDNFYDAAFINSCAVMHPARLMSLQLIIDRLGPFSVAPRFYEDWDDVASEWAISLDRELLAVASAKGASVMPFLEYYESKDAASLTHKIRSIPAFKGITTPLARDGFLDTNSRYIQSDIYLSLRYMIQVASELSIRTPVADAIWSRFKPKG